MIFFSKLYTVVNVISLMIRMTTQIVRGIWKISAQKKPIITIYGSSRLAQDSLYAIHAQEIAKKLLTHNVYIVGGGGPGIMQAINCAGTQSSSHQFFSVLIRGLSYEEKPNPCLHEWTVTDYFFVRKFLLRNYAHGFIVFPGGFGTLDEFFELLNLLHTGKQKPVPIVLFGTDFWAPLHDLIAMMAKHDTITNEDQKLFYSTDSVDQAIEYLLHNQKP